jgi:hypothetical protein
MAAASLLLPLHKKVSTTDKDNDTLISTDVMNGRNQSHCRENRAVESTAGCKFT